MNNEVRSVTCFASCHVGSSVWNL